MEISEKKMMMYGDGKGKNIVILNDAFKDKNNLFVEYNYEDENSENLRNESWIDDGNLPEDYRLPRKAVFDVQNQGASCGEFNEI